MRLFRKLLLFLALCLPLAVNAQTLRVELPHVSVLYNAETVGKVLYDAASEAFVIGEARFPIAEIQEMAYEEAKFEPLLIEVDYDAAHVRVPGELYAHLTLNAFQEEGVCSIIADESIQDELIYALRGTGRSFYMDGVFKSTVMLNGLTLNAVQGAAMHIQNGKRIKIVMAEGSENTFSDTAGGTHKAAFFVNGHAEIEGSGTISLTGRTKHAYASDEYTIFKSSAGAFNVLSAVSDGLHVEQYFEQRGGVISVQNVGGDNVDVSLTKDPNDERNGEGLITGGELRMNVATDDTKGLKVAGLLSITGGTITASVSADGGKGISAGGDLEISKTETTSPSITMNVTGTTFAAGTEQESKCRGIKVKGNLTFDGGTISITATGRKSKAISVDGIYYYKSGSINCSVDAAASM